MAGGIGKRMGGLDKCALRLGDKTFLELLTEALSGFSEILLSGYDISETGDTKLRSVADVVPGFGPMGGVYSVLLASESDALLIISCDMPLFSKSLAEKLVSAMDEGTDALICLSMSGRKNPLCGIYSKTCLPQLEACIKAGNLKLFDMLDSVRCRYYETGEDSWMLRNINTPAELIALKNGRIPPHIMKGRRNRVELIVDKDELFVIKTFARNEDLENELQALNMLKAGGIPAAAAERYGEKKLKLEFLYGVTALELFEGLESEGLGFQKRDRGYCRLLCAFIKSVYRCFFESTGKKLCLNDMNLRNFIYQPEYDRFTGVDFELVGEGSYERDSGVLLAFVLAYEPQDTPYKRAMVEFMLDLLSDELCISREKIKAQMEEEQKAMALRRKNKTKSK